MQSFGVPQGMRDILIEESSKRTILKESLLHYMKSCGFDRIEMPLFEYYELFSGGISPVDEESIIKTIDRDGRVVVLRPDMTIPTARVVVTKLKEQQRPLKLCYLGNIYRSDKKNRGSLREFCQVGAEIYGCRGKWLDIEIISMAKESFGEAGVSNYKIDIGHVGIIKGIFQELALSEENKAFIISLINDKNLVELEKEVAALSIESRYKKIICSLPRFFGRPEDVFKRIDEIIINDTVKESADYLFEVYEKCRDMGLGANLIIDAGMTGNMKYYSGLIFKAYAQGTSNVVISGGSYDDLLDRLGANMSAAGFAIYIDSMLEAAAKENITQLKERKILVIFCDNRFIEALEYSNSCRKDGIAVSMVNSSDISEPEKYCRQYGYDEIMNFI